MALEVVSFMGLHVDLEMCGAKTVTHRVKKIHEGQQATLI